jgi:hypothetical protein
VYILHFFFFLGSDIAKPTSSSSVLGCEVKETNSLFVSSTTSAVVFRTPLTKGTMTSEGPRDGGQSLSLSAAMSGLSFTANQLDIFGYQTPPTPAITVETTQSPESSPLSSPHSARHSPLSYPHSARHSVDVPSLSLGVEMSRHSFTANQLDIFGYQPSTQPPDNVISPAPPKKRRRGKRACKTCGHVGHYTKTCPRRSADAQPAARPATNGPRPPIRGVRRVSFSPQALPQPPEARRLSAPIVSVVVSAPVDCSSEDEDRLDECDLDALRLGSLASDNEDTSDDDDGGEVVDAPPATGFEWTPYEADVFFGSVKEWVGPARPFRSRDGGGTVNTRRSIKQEVELFDLIGFPSAAQHRGLRYTNKYLRSKHPAESTLCMREFRALLGVVLFMGQSQRVRRADFWGDSEYGSAFVKSAFPDQARFSRALGAIRWASEATYSASDRARDSLWRLRPLIGTACLVRDSSYVTVQCCNVRFLCLCAHVSVCFLRADALNKSWMKGYNPVQELRSVLL